MKILVYGVGGMGKFFKDFFYVRGYYVKGYDIVSERCDVREDEIQEFDVIFVCVPMDSLEEALKHIKAKASNPLLVDISSIKSASLPLFDSIGFDYLSIHPMFGGDSEIGLSNIIIVEESGRKEEEIILKEFENS